MCVAEGLTVATSRFGEGAVRLRQLRRCKVWTAEPLLHCGGGGAFFVWPVSNVLVTVRNVFSAARRRFDWNIIIASAVCRVDERVVELC